MNKKIKDLLIKKNISKIICLTSYSQPIAKIISKYCDIILIGDSMANVLYGMKNTHKRKKRASDCEAKQNRRAIGKFNQTVLSILDMFRLCYLKKSYEIDRKEHALLKEEINLDERI